MIVFSKFQKAAWRWLLAGALLGAAPVHAQEVDDDLSAVFVDQARQVTQVVGIDADWNIKLQGDSAVSVVAADELIYWGEYRDRETGPQIILVAGGLLRADPLELTADGLTIGDATGLSRTLWDESTLPRTAVKGVLLQPPADAIERDKLIDRVRTYDQADDLLLLTSGETVSGRLVEAPRAGRFLPEDETPADVYKLVRTGVDEPLTVPASKVVGILFGGRQVARAQPGEADAQLGFSDGSLLSVQRIEVKGDTVRLHLTGGGILSAPFDQPDESAPTIWHQLTWLRPANRRVTYLSDLTPIGYKHIPLLTLDWPYGDDRNDLGGALRSKRALWSKGLGMHPISRLAYDLNGQYRRFEAEIALDAAAGMRGSVVFKVLVERQPNQWSTAFESPVVRGGDQPIPVSVDVKDARRMALIVDYADRADELDHANWLMARLID